MKRFFTPATILNFIQKNVFFLLLFLYSNAVMAQQVTEVITDFGGYWKSAVGALNATYPNTSHNLLSFKYNSVVYSTGANDNKLDANGISYVAGDFRGFPITSIGGKVTSGTSVYAALASKYDGVPNGFSNPLPSLKMNDVLIDGIHGLDLGTGVTNIPASSIITFPVTAVQMYAISDEQPDIVMTQIADPSANGDTLYFIDSAGAIVGNKIAINWSTVSKLGTYYLDLYTFPVGALCDTAKINGTSASETTRDIRLLAFKLSDFGITITNVSTIKQFILRESGTSDPAFVAYNAGALTIPAPEITVQPVAQIVCPDVSNSVTFSVTATGGSLSYQWRKNNTDISGATSRNYTISSVTSASAGAYNVVVTNPVGSVASNTVYLNLSISVQPSPAVQVIATGASCTLSVSANNATSYQWRKGSTDISEATSATYIINPVNTADTSSYSVLVKNDIGEGCANIISNTVKVIGSNILYSKANVNLNIAGSWGVATDGSGSSPVNFTRAEHIFIVKNNASTGGNLTIAGTLDVANAVTTITPNTTLDSRKIIRSGSGALAGSATANLTVRDTSNLYFKAPNNILKNFTIYNGKTSLLNALSITAGSTPGSVIMDGGTLFTGDSLTIKSDASGTASVATVASGASITGQVTVERFIPGVKKAWRFLAVPTVPGQSIHDAWQENQDANSTSLAGKGIQLTGNVVGWNTKGFDLYSSTLSIKTYNSANNTWVGVNSTLDPFSATAGGYMTFIRGDRTSNSFYSPVTSTVLRTKGQLYVGDQANISVTAKQFIAVNNPYAAALDIRQIYNSANLFFYVWDPNLASSLGYGGYQTLVKGASGDYTAIPGGGSYSGTNANLIQSGSAFFVYNNDGGNLTIKESAKASVNPNTIAFTPTTAPVENKSVTIQLYGVDAAGNATLLDGVLQDFDETYSSGIDGMDAQKLTNTSETFSIKTQGQLLSVERRNAFFQNDTTFLNLTAVKAQAYRIVLNTKNLDGVAAFLEDSYLKTKTPIIVDGTTAYDYTIVNIPGSYAADRMKIIYQQQKVLPVTFTSISATQKGKDIAVEWKVENESNMKQYEVEKSIDGNNFSKAATLAANNKGTETFSWLDVATVTGYNYYRIRSVDINGKTAYTQIVKVQLGGITKQEISIFPNPIVNAVINLQLTNQAKGIYHVRVMNQVGQPVLFKEINHSEGSSTETFQLNKNLARGMYQVEITNPAGEVKSVKIIN